VIDTDTAPLNWPLILPSSSWTHWFESSVIAAEALRLYRCNPEYRHLRLWICFRYRTIAAAADDYCAPSTHSDYYHLLVWFLGSSCLRILDSSCFIALSSARPPL